MGNLQKKREIYGSLLGSRKISFVYKKKKGGGILLPELSNL